MPLPPLTHHEILSLVGPFTRRGRRVDLDATDRVERRLVFKPLDHLSDAPGSPGLREHLQLESPWAGTFRVTRTCQLANGLQSSLQVEGPEPAALLALVEDIRPRSQFRFGEGYVIALRQQLHLPGPKGPRAQQLLLEEGVARVGGLTLTLRMPSVRGIPADLKLTAEGRTFIDLPEDLLAVVGWDWAPLLREDDAWISKLRLHGRGGDRSRRAEAKLEKTAAHLAQTLSEPPARFHERFLTARWWAAFRRGIPMVTCVSFGGGVLLLPRPGFEVDSITPLAVMNAPLLVIGLSFTLQEMSRLEIPPLPRPCTEPAWQRAPAPGPKDQASMIPPASVETR